VVDIVITKSLMIISTSIASSKTSKLLPFYLNNEIKERKFEENPKKKRI
jgi:hypothetical protein